MISCTEFIPSYSELFSFIHKRDGYDGVTDFWKIISDKYVEQRLGNEVAQNGIEGCFNYWSQTLNEEAADFTMNLNKKEGYFEIIMHECPSKKRLVSYDQVNPYPYYCFHCDLLYRRVLEKFDFLYFYDIPKGLEYNCKMRVIDPNVASTDFIEETRRLYRE